MDFQVDVPFDCMKVLDLTSMSGSHGVMHHPAPRFGFTLVSSWGSRGYERPTGGTDSSIFGESGGCRSGRIQKKISVICSLMTNLQIPTLPHGLGGLEGPLGVRGVAGGLKRFSGDVPLHPKQERPEPIKSI